MKTLFFVGLYFLSFTASAQYFYNDILGTKESADLIQSYRKNKVQKVTLNSYTVGNAPLKNFSIQQEYLASSQALLTTTATEYTAPSYLTSYADAAGRVIKTTDSTDSLVNITTYTYTNNGKLATVIFKPGDTLAGTQLDEHIWQYDAQGHIHKMFRVKNKKDTLYVSFKTDAAGNVTEEQESHYGIKPEPYLYYYDDQNRLTDVVRFNKKAGRLLPEMMFEYSEKNQIIQRINVSQTSSQYLIWRFQYNDKGLKTKEVVFNKDKEQTGKIEYQYSFMN